MEGCDVGYIWRYGDMDSRREYKTFIFTFITFIGFVSLSLSLSLSLSFSLLLYIYVFYICFWNARFTTGEEGGWGINKVCEWEGVCVGRRGV